MDLNGTTDLGIIKLHAATDQLGEVVIKSRAPVVIKRDTLEFNVESFKTKKDATIEDLLKQLPGVEVGLDGTITVNGKPVSEIMVNGKPFFGNDPTIATRNLTKEMIEKIQITDTKSESQAFTGEGGDQESKTLKYEAIKLSFIFFLIFFIFSPDTNGTSDKHNGQNQQYISQHAYICPWFCKADFGIQYSHSLNNIRRKNKV